MQGGETATGQVLLEDGSIKVLGDSPQQFARAELLSVTAGVPKERNYWTEGVGRWQSALGQYGRGRGQRKRVISAPDRREPRTPRLSWQLQQHQRRGILEQHRANAVWDWFFSEKLFLRPVFFEYFKDPFQNIDSRYTLGTGLGYQLIDTARTDWSIFAGPAYQRTRFDAVEPGKAATRIHGHSARAPPSKRRSPVKSTSTTTTRSNSPTRSPASTTIT
jgi:hypothetical protein